MSKLSRRDFLKIATAFSAGLTIPSLPFSLGEQDRQNSENVKNIIIILFDQMSARHLSIYGYERQTTPNFTRFAERSTVYHSHYSAANFTSPGTATTLTGMYPWKHRAFDHGSMIKRDLVNQNIFNLLGSSYHTVGFAQNFWADLLLAQFHKSVGEHLPPTSFTISGNTSLLDKFRNDWALAYYAFPDFLISPILPSSLVGGYLNDYNFLRKGRYYRYGFPDYPKGIPTIPEFNVVYRNEDMFDGVRGKIEIEQKSRTPYFSYFHFYSPHYPYIARKDFMKLFLRDTYMPPEKPHHVLGGTHKYKDVLKYRIQYDQIIANVDAEFGRLLDWLAKDGVLDDSYVVVTSDHGQLFERGDHGHGSPLLYESVIRIPLIISAPGQRTRQDIYSLTNNIDLTPTLLHIAGKDIPDTLDGKILPGFGGVEDNNRSIYSMVSLQNSAFLPLTKTTIAMCKEDYKLIYYLGYPGYDNVFELYNVRDDPEELNDLAKSDIVRAAHMKEELLAALDTANKPFRKK